MCSPLLTFHPSLGISDPQGPLTGDQTEAPVGHEVAGIGEYGALLIRLTVFTLSSKINSSGAAHLDSGCGHREHPLKALLEQGRAKQI